jgi:hypothetical protein
MPDPTTITLTPATVALRAGGGQNFVAVGTPAPGGAASSILDPNSFEWNLSPNVGSMNAAGMYEAPDDVLDDTSVTVTAIDKASGNQAKAVVSLLSPSWRGVGATFLGVYIFLVFSTAFLLIRLWPVGSIDPVTARTARLEAEAKVTQTTNDLKAATGNQTQPASSQTQGNANLSGAAPAQAEGSATTTGTVPSKPDQNSALITSLQNANDLAQRDLAKKMDDESKANSLCVQTSFQYPINREFDLLLLVLLAGMLGAFLHMARSYVDFRGNRTLKKSWLWWYLLQPFLGGALALVFYATLRGGLVSIVPASHTSTADLNTSGMIALSSLVGLFSKSAISKLGDVFGTLFQTDSANKMKDKVDNGTPPTPTTPTQGQGATTPSAQK